MFHLHAVLRNALEHAVREDLIPRHVAKQVRVTPGPRDEPQPWSVEEAKTFLKAVRGDRWYALYAVALSLGLRRGEALGLRWVDVETDAEVLRVRQTLQRHGGTLHTAPPKTRRSLRTLPLLGGLAAVLEEHRERQSANAKASATGGTNRDSCSLPEGALQFSPTSCPASSLLPANVQECGESDCTSSGTLVHPCCLPKVCPRG